MKKCKLLFLLPLAGLMLGSCSIEDLMFWKKKQDDSHEKEENSNNEITRDVILENSSIHHDDEFGGAFVDISISEFNNLGFQFGDALELNFSNGVTYKDIGYYSGYYVPAGKELVVGYPGYEYIKFCINYGDDVYTMNRFDQSTTVTIKVDEAGKYKAIEDTLNISYSDDPISYPTIEEFANFRMVRTGNILKGNLFRGASPIDNRRNRVEIVNELLEDNGIKTILNLADSRATIDSFYEKGIEAPYFRRIDENQDVVALGMGAAYKSEDFSSKMKLLVEGICDHPAPYYVHCLEGKDRTGYVCMVLEALCGATYQNLVDDYFVTYHNYYGIAKGSEKYNLIKEIHIDEMIKFVFSFEPQTNLLTANYSMYAREYLKSTGLTDSQIDIAIQNLTSYTY